jgi:DnaJ-class molecular chaperone with C-terminal Zn finger domain
MAKYKTPNTAPLGLYHLKDLPRGEYVRRVDLCEACHGEGEVRGECSGAMVPCGTCVGKGYIREYKTTWIKGEYNRSFPNAGKFELTRFDDVSTTCYRSGSVLVLAGFTF